MKVSVSDLYGVWHESPIFVCMNEVKSIDDSDDVLLTVFDDDDDMKCGIHSLNGRVNVIITVLMVR